MFLEQRLRRVCCVRDLYVGGVYLWVASVGLGDVVDQPQSVVQPESPCHDGLLVRSVSERIGILGNARSGAKMCVDGVVDLFTTDVPGRRRHFDLRGVLLHVELLSTPPQPIGVVCVPTVFFNVDV